MSFQDFSQLDFWKVNGQQRIPLSLTSTPPSSHYLFWACFRRHSAHSWALRAELGPENCITAASMDQSKRFNCLSRLKSALYIPAFNQFFDGFDSFVLPSHRLEGRGIVSPLFASLIGLHRIKASSAGLAIRLIAHGRAPGNGVTGRTPDAPMALGQPKDLKWVIRS